MVRRAVRPARSPRGSRLPPPAPTPADRSASPPPSPASAGSSRPMAVAAAGASSPSLPASTRRARWHAASKTARSCSRPWRASIPRMRPACRWTCPLGKRASRQTSRARRSVSRRNTGWTAPTRKSSRAGSRARNGCATRARQSSMSACRTPNMRCPPITSSPPPKPRAISRAMTACVMACATCLTGRGCRTCMPPPAPPASVTRSSAGS